MGSRGVLWRFFEHGTPDRWNEIDEWRGEERLDLEEGCPVALREEALGAKADVEVGWVRARAEGDEAAGGRYSVWLAWREDEQPCERGKGQKTLL